MQSVDAFVDQYLAGEAEVGDFFSSFVQSSPFISLILRWAVIAVQCNYAAGSTPSHTPAVTKVFHAYLVDDQLHQVAVFIRIGLHNGFEAVAMYGDGNGVWFYWRHGLPAAKRQRGKSSPAPGF